MSKKFTNEKKESICQALIERGIHPSKLLDPRARGYTKQSNDWHRITVLPEKFADHAESKRIKRALFTLEPLLETQEATDVAIKALKDWKLDNGCVLRCENGQDRGVDSSEIESRPRSKALSGIPPDDIEISSGSSDGDPSPANEWSSSTGDYLSDKSSVKCCSNRLPSHGRSEKKKDEKIGCRSEGTRRSSRKEPSVFKSTGQDAYLNSREPFKRYPKPPVGSDDEFGNEKLYTQSDVEHFIRKIRWMNDRLKIEESRNQFKSLAVQPKHRIIYLPPRTSAASGEKGGRGSDAPQSSKQEPIVIANYSDEDSDENESSFEELKFKERMSKIAATAAVANVGRRDNHGTRSGCVIC